MLEGHSKEKDGVSDSHEIQDGPCYLHDTPIATSLVASVQVQICLSTSPFNHLSMYPSIHVPMNPWFGKSGKSGEVQQFGRSNLAPSHAAFCSAMHLPKQPIHPSIHRRDSPAIDLSSRPSMSQNAPGSHQICEAFQVRARTLKEGKHKFRSLLWNCQAWQWASGAGESSLSSLSHEKLEDDHPQLENRHFRVWAPSKILKTSIRSWTSQFSNPNPATPEKRSLQS